MILLGAWTLIIGGVLTLLIAANSKEQRHRCTGVSVALKSAGEQLYIDRDDVVEVVSYASAGQLLGKPIEAINLAKLEKALEANPWIGNAELYFDREHELHILVEERQPIARVFTTAGRSFYIDSAAQIMPLLDSMSARVPVITGFTNARAWGAEDSALMQQVKLVASFVYADPFWNAQIGQIDITRNRSFELIPLIGDHVIRIGDGNGVEEKLRRLEIFYSNVLPKVGLQKYEAIDVRFRGQVVGVKRGETSAVDSVQLQKNIESLIRNAAIRDAAEEGLDPTYFKPGSATVDLPATAQEPAARTPSPAPVVRAAAVTPPKAKQATPVKSNPVRKPVQTSSPSRKPGPKPKAVMQRTTNR